MKIAVVLGVSLIFIVPAVAADAAVWHVGNTTQLIRAIAGANNETVHPGEDTIVLAPGTTYTLTAAGNDSDGETGLPSITSRIVIRGNGALIERDRTTGTSLFRIFHIAPSGDLAMDGITVSNGYSGMGGSGGGGVYNLGRVSMTDCTFKDSAAWGYGGGIENRGSMTMTSCTVRDNFSIEGAGVYNTGALTMNGCSISGNSAAGKPVDDGGGIYNNGTLDMRDCTVSGNTVSAGSGGNGGGLYNGSGGRLTMVNCTISDNIVTYADMCSGGGIFNSGAVLMHNCTVSGNSVTAYGGGLGGGVFTSATGLLQMSNSIVANQASGMDCDKPVISLGYNLDGDGSCGLTAAGDKTAGNANLGPLQDNGGPAQTRELLAGSSAIDAGDPGGCVDADGQLLARDQRGFVRPVNGGSGIARCDMGAYESISHAEPYLYVSADGLCSGKIPCYSTVQGAVDAAAYGSVVLVSGGTYHENIQLKSGVVLQGEGSGTTTLSGTGNGSVVSAVNVDSAAKIDGFTITGGNSAAYGGGIHNTMSSPTISNNVIAGNLTGDRGGGIYNINGSSPLIMHNTITGNSASGGGGGIFNQNNSSPVISDNVITSNSAAWCGGGICNSEGSSPTISNNIISANTAAYGGGIGNSESSPVILNNTIITNTANDYAGGIDNGSNSAPVIANNIVASNTGGGISCGNAATVIDYNDIWSNSSYDVSGCTVGLHGISAAPLFVASAGGDFRLQPGSPCVDAGDTSLLSPRLTTDIYGNPRQADGNGDGTATVDMGAAELYPASIRTLTVQASGGGSGTVQITSTGGGCTVFPCSLRFMQGSGVTLGATAEQGSGFAGWRGGCSGPGPCTVTVNGDISVTAAFTLEGEPCAAPGVPSGADPADGASGVSVGALPSWENTSAADSYDLYLGTSADPPFAGESVSPGFTGVVLNYDTTYYWRVVARKNCGSAASGPVLSFSTAAFCDNLPVRIPGRLTVYYYMSLQAAYEAASDGNVIELQALEYAENPVLGRDVSVTLGGGHDCAYSADAGNTMISGRLTVSGGPVTVMNLILR